MKMIDINKLRRKLHSDDLIDHVDIHANVKPVLTELLDRTETAEKERDALRARIEAMEKQDPVAWQMSHPSLGDGWLDTNDAHAEWLRANKYGEWKVRPLYLAPGAQAAVPEDIHRDAMRYRALCNIPAEYPAVFAHSGADDYGWFLMDGADLDEIVDELIAAVPKPENP